ncbi:MAG: hypothetical protein R3234_09955, partial [Thermoanaerobaculia bacterium]|nr:hypothetical protein [Thermoanaerobaculia bacterium]
MNEEIEMGHGTSKTRRSAPCWPAVLLAGIALVAVPAALQAQPPVAVSVDVSGDEVPRATLTATAVVEINDGSSVTGYQWSLVGDAPAELQGTRGQSVQVTLGPAFEFRFHLHDLLHEPPIEPEDLPPDIDFGEHEFHGGLTDRFQVVGLNHFVLEEAALVVLQVEVTTTSGTYHGEAEIHTALPWRPTSGIENVPINIPVVLHGKHQDSYDWSMTPPAGSSATLNGASSLFPVFTPDIAGIYEIQVTDEASGEPVTMTIYAGNWRGVIVGQDENGRPVADAICTACHSGGQIPDPFTPWKETGHAEIFTDNLNTSPYWGTRCFDCHTVGYDPAYANNGIDEASDYQAFLNSGLIGNPPGDDWTIMLQQFPMSAKKANVQCENCHGPNSSEPGLDTLAHGWIPTVEGEPRVSISSDVCARCHGEPLRHARFQQWQLSPHANYDLAISRGGSGSCGRCHSGNGFLEWLPVLTGEKEGDPTASIEVTYTSDEIHPQTCVTCHDPHAVGTTSGAENDAQMRIEGNTPPLLAGFQAFGVGRGAICMTCHNSRRGLKHDGNFDEVFGTSDADRAPHAGAQADIVMGENAYMVNTGIRGAHSLIEDSCTQCHMEETAPPDLLSYNQGGTNHTFRASPAVCANCHEGLTATGIQAAVEAMNEHLKGLIEDELFDLIVAQLDQGYTIDLDGERTITDAAAIEEIVLTEFHGRQGMAVVFANDT